MPAVSFVSGGSFPAALEAAELFLPKGSVAAQAAGSFCFPQSRNHHTPSYALLDVFTHYVIGKPKHNACCHLRTEGQTSFSGEPEADPCGRRQLNAKSQYDILQI